jgi:hypothetical protein
MLLEHGHEEQNYNGVHTYKGYGNRSRTKPVAAVCTLLLVKDCSARGRKVGK